MFVAAAARRSGSRRGHVSSRRPSRPCGRNRSSSNAGGKRRHDSVIRGTINSANNSRTCRCIGSRRSRGRAGVSVDGGGCGCGGNVCDAISSSRITRTRIERMMCVEAQYVMYAGGRGRNHSCTITNDHRYMASHMLASQHTHPHTHTH